MTEPEMKGLGLGRQYCTQCNTPRSSEDNVCPQCKAVPSGTPPSPRLLQSLPILATFACVMLCSGVSLILYAVLIRPAQLSTQAAITARIQQTTQAHRSATAQAQSTSTAISQATATTNTYQKLYLQTTTLPPTLDEPLTAQTDSNWDNYRATEGGGCTFTGDALHANVSQQHFYVPCFAHNTKFSNFAFEAQVMLLSGDQAGIIFRANDVTSQFYVFRINRDGTYSFLLSKDSQHITPLLEDTCPFIKTKPGQPNIVTVIAQNNTFYLYINKQYVTSISDDTYLTGEIGLFASDINNATSVAFSNVRVWQLP